MSYLAWLRLSIYYETNIVILGIGAAVIHAFAAAGCTKIILLDNNSTSLAAAETILRTAFSVVDSCCILVDISQEGAVNLNVRSAISNTVFGGRLDYVVNCAGINGIDAPHPPTATDETSVAWFDKINGINYHGTWMANRAFLGIMKEQEVLGAHDGKEKRGQRGAIVNLSSGLGIVSMLMNRKF